MAGVDVRISELPAATEGHADDRFETTQVDGATLVSRSITLEQVSDAVAAVLPPPVSDWDDITGKPTTFPPTVPIAWTDVSGKPATFPPTLPIAYSDISGKPSTFPPDPEAVDDRVAALIVAGANMTATYNDVANTLTLASTASGGGGGTVTSTSVVSANGLAGTVATPTTTPAITLSTTVTGMLKGNGTAISAGTAGTDYMTPGNVSAAYQPLDADLTALAGLNATAGLVEQTGAAAFTKRLIGVTNATDIPTRANADARYAPISVVGTLTGVTAGTGITVSGSAPSPTVGITNAITAGGPVGNATTVPVITYNAQGMLTAVSTATISGGAATSVGTTPPGSPTDGQLWYYSDAINGGGALYIRYNDGNSTAWVPASPAPTNNAASVVRTTKFTSGGTWTPNANMVYARAQGWGAGGAGGSTVTGPASTFIQGGGGAAGSWAKVIISKATAGASQVVTIGAAAAQPAAGNVAGGAGGDTSLGTLLIAKGGNGGGGNNGTSVVGLGGLGVSGGTGDEVGIGMSGGTGANAASVFMATGIGGSAPPIGSGGRGTSAAITAVQNGEAAIGLASGGAGGASYNAGGTSRGGVGTGGYLVIEEYCTA